MKKSKNQSYVFTNKKLNAIVPRTNCLSTATPDIISCSDNITCTGAVAAVGAAAAYQSHGDVYLSANDAQEMLTSSQSLQNQQPAIPSVPASSAYRGSHGFELSFLPSNKEKKPTTWTYSPTLKKLFVRMANTCPVRFKTSTGNSPPSHSIIRLMPVYMKPENVQEVVRRCPNHSSKPEYNESHPAPQHLLFCTHNRAQYVEDPYTGRLSVVIPHEQPQAGTEWVTYLVKFMCFSSCVGGLNRRPVQLIFTLEHNNVVLGRQSVEVRICACPVRDRRTEEKGAGPSKPVATKSASTGNSGGKAKRSRGSADRDEINPKQHRMNTQAAEEEEEDEGEDEEEEDDKVYTLTVHGRENLALLKRIRDSLEIAALMTAGQRQMLTEQQLDIRQQQQQQQQQPQQAQHQIQQQQQIYANSASSKSHQISQQFHVLPQLPVYSHHSTVPQIQYSTGGVISTDCAGSVHDDQVTENEVTSSCIASNYTYNQPMSHEDVTITSWLNHLELSLYVDYFHQLGFYHMHDLQNFSLHDLDLMNIGMAHRNKIWRALVEYRNRNESVHPPTLAISGADSLAAHAAMSVITEPVEEAGRHVYDTDYYTDVIFMPAVQHQSIKEEDHNYCQ